MQRNTAQTFLAQAALAVALASSVSAASYTWNSTSAGNWNNTTATGWNTDPAPAYPNAAGDTATFSQELTANRTISITTTDARVASLTLADTTPSHGWTVAGTSSNKLTLDNGASAATVSATSGTHTISAPIALASNVTFSVTGTQLNITGGISGAKSLTLASGSTGTLRISGVGLSSITSTTVNGGILSFNGENAPSAGNISVNNEGTLRVTGTYGGLNDGTLVTLAGAGVFDFSGYTAGTDWFSGVASASTTSSWKMGATGSMEIANRTFDGVISGGGSGTITFSNGYTLGNANTYVGSMYVKGGTLKLNVANSIAATQLSVNTSAVVDVGSNNQTFVSLAGGGSIRNTVDGSNTITITGGNNKNFSGAIQNSTAARILNLRINATGTQILSGTNTYTGTTTIDAGSLVVNGSLLSSVTVNGGTLGGSGTVGGINVGLAGALAPGNSPGILSTGGNLTLNGKLVAEINGATAGVSGYDQVIVGGNVTLGAASNLDFLLGYAPSGSESFTLILNNGSNAIGGAIASVNGTALSGNSFTTSYSGTPYTFSINYAGGDGNDLVITIPEPATLSLVTATTALLARRRRKA